MKDNKKMLMFFKNLVSVMILFVVLIYINLYEVQALTIKPREEITEKLNKYPGYVELINNLKQAYPNWNFRILYTGLDWNQVIESEASHGRNLVSRTRASSWICSTCGDTPYDNGSWRCASKAAISYFMDPRNSLNETYVFQFESLSYNKDVQTIEGVEQIIKDVKYMQTDKITYTKTDGTQGVINKTYAQIIMEAAQESNVSPYHLAARIRQEQGTDSSPSVLASGNYPGYIGYYNFFNIKASGNGNAQIIANGLTYAKNKGFTDPELSIKGGAKFLASDYISGGQDTLYLQKFDVDDSDGTLYYFQYMQNLSASKSEGTKARESYQKLGLIDTKIDFIIPVYENMPIYPCPEPTNASIVTQNVKVIGDTVRIRKENSINSEILKEVNKEYGMLRIELAEKQIDGYYWDKVVIENGVKGYVARNFIQQVEDVKECNESMVVTSTANLRNGPGAEGTIIITNLVKGQLITRIEKDKYNLDGYIWDRVILADGRQGYVAQEYISLPNNDNNSENSQEEITNEIIRVICKSGLNVRKEPGIDKKVSAYLNRYDTLTRIEQSVSNANGYIWDKVVTSDGIEGYIARGNSTESYIEVVSVVKVKIPKDDNDKPVEDEPEDNEDIQNYKNDKMKIEGTKLICVPEAIVQDAKELFKDKQVKVIKQDKTEITEGNLATGYVISINNKEYNIVKLGDVNSDGKINSGDLFNTQKYLLKQIDFNDILTKACDVNKDQKINSGDLFYIQKYLLKQTKLTI